METYVILSHFSTDAVAEPGEMPELARLVSEKIKSQCPDVHWRHSWATMGYFDVVDIIEAPNFETVEKVLMIIRAYGHAETQAMPAVPWKTFISDLKSKEERRQEQMSEQEYHRIINP